MPARKVAVYTTVGEQTYAPGDEVPAEVVALIDNPAVWEVEGDDESPKPVKKAAPKRSSN